MLSQVLSKKFKDIIKYLFNTIKNYKQMEALFSS
jgi:hypothetical protein